MAIVKQVIYSLDNFVAGNNLKIFSSSDNNYYSKLNTQLSSLDKDANFYYFYRDNKNIRLVGDYTSASISAFQKSLTNDADKVYFDHELSGILLNSKSGIARNNDNYYFINDFKFKNNLINDDDNYRLNYVSTYISNSYLSSFYTDSLIVKDQTIPIYRFNEDQLKNIDILKFQSQDIVDDIISSFEIDQIKDEITYNTKYDRLDKNQYDAIYIYPILQHYINSNQKLDNFYKFIFSNLSKDSFYRILIPIGKISDVALKDKISKTTDISQYMYYLNPKQNSLLKVQNDEISFNYFDLKNLQNPHDEYDYVICGNINQNLSVKSNAFSLTQMNKFNMINFTSEFIKNLQTFIQSRYWKTYADQYIQINQLFDQVVQFGYNTFDGWTSGQVSSLMLQKDAYFKYTVIEQAFESLYNINVNTHSYLITLNEINLYVDESQLEFNNKFESFKDTDLMKACLNVYSEIRQIFVNSANNYIVEDQILLNYYTEGFLSLLKSRDFKALNNILASGDIGLYKPVMKSIFDNSNIFNNYYKSFDSLFAHENIMKKDGMLLGHRTYNKIFTSFDNYLNASYNYQTIEDNTFKASVSSDFDSTAYQKMLNNISKYEFLQKIEGFFKYKDLNLPKSNIYSIQLKNSNLNYQIYSYDEMIKYCLLNYSDEVSSYNYSEKCFYPTAFGAETIPFIKFIDSHNFGIILQSSLNENVDLLKLRENVWSKIPLSSFKYYDKTNKLNQNINLKIQMRKRLQASIRQSIAKYMPVDTTLWKIKYTGI